LENSWPRLENFREKHRQIKCFGGEWCNGSTTDSDSVCLGSNPGSPAIPPPQIRCRGRWLAAPGHVARGARQPKEDAEARGCTLRRQKSLSCHHAVTSLHQTPGNPFANQRVYRSIDCGPKGSHVDFSAMMCGSGVESLPGWRASACAAGDSGTSRRPAGRLAR
jgi:hypothetical protein